MEYLTGESGETFKVNLYDHGAGVAVADYDADGDDDIYLLNQLGPNTLYRNDGVRDGLPAFTDVTATAGVGLTDRVAMAACFADADGDGDRDLFVTSTRGGDAFFRNDGGDRFTDVSAAAGTAHVGHTETPAFFDADGDGDLDLLVTSTAGWTTDVRHSSARYYEGAPDFLAVTKSPPERNRFYRNDGGLRFTECAEAAGLAGAGWGGDIATFDYDHDGDTDVFVSNMFGSCSLLRNDGKGVFTDVTAAALGKTPWGAVGAKVLDYDGDGRLDLYVADMHSDMWFPPPGKASYVEPAAQYDDVSGRSVQLGLITLAQRDELHDLLPVRGRAVIYGSALFRNRGDGTFEETGRRAGTETWWPWGAAAADFDLDGDADLFIPAGMGYPFFPWPNSYLQNQGDGTFRDAAQKAGLDPPPGGTYLQGKVAGRTAAKSSRAAAVGDFDGDGRPDLVVNNFNDVAHLWMNRHETHPWIGFRLRAKSGGIDPVGAEVTVRSGGRTLVRHVETSGGYLAQSTGTLHIGLGAEHRGNVTCTVRWPGGREQVVEGLAAGRVHVVAE